MTRALSKSKDIDPREPTEKEIDLFRLILSRAADKSTDPSTQNGAALVDRGSLKIKVLEVNEFPKNVEETPERWERPQKYQFVEHAERNALYRACSEGICTRLLAMYCPWFACADCARGIARCNIFNVVGMYLEDEEKHPGWTQTCEVGNIILDEAGVRREYVKMPHLGIKIRRNEQVIEI